MEVMQRARARLAAAKADRESENRQHLAQAYERLPRLREIDRQLRMTMAAAAQAAFSQGSDVQSVMEEVKRKNLALQQERQQLVHLYFRKVIWMTVPFAPIAAAAAMWAQQCANVWRSCAGRSRRRN